MLCVNSHPGTDRLGKSQWMPKRTSIDDQTPEVFDPPLSMPAAHREPSRKLEAPLERMAGESLQE